MLCLSAGVIFTTSLVVLLTLTEAFFLEAFNSLAGLAFFTTFTFTLVVLLPSLTVIVVVPAFLPFTLNVSFDPDSLIPDTEATFAFDDVTFGF